MQSFTIVVSADEADNLAAALSAAAAQARATPGQQVDIKPNQTKDVMGEDTMLAFFIKPEPVPAQPALDPTAYDTATGQLLDPAP